MMLSNTHRNFIAQLICGKCVLRYNFSHQMSTCN